MDNSRSGNQWDEKLSIDFIDYGSYFVPERENQIRIIADLLAFGNGPEIVIELCCGEGLLAEAVLEECPHCQLRGYDGSQTMLDLAIQRLGRFGERFQPVLFELSSNNWRVMSEPIHAVVTSLAIHHLMGPEKARLFNDVYHMLAPGGVFIIADIVDPNHPRSKVLAADAYDAFVEERSMLLDGHLGAFDFFQKEGWNIFRELDPEDIDKPDPLFNQLLWLDSAGFSHIDIFWMMAGHVIFGGWKE